MTLPFNAFAWQFAAACASSIVLAGVSAVLLHVAARRWPALRAHRSAWAMAQAAVVIAFAIALLPSAQVSVLPVIELGELSAPAVPDIPDTVSPLHATTAASPPAEVAQSLIGWLPFIWACIYLAGLLHSLARQMRSSRQWRALARQSRRLDAAELAAHGAFTGTQLGNIAQAGCEVRESDAAISPVLLGIRRPCLLLPVHMRNFSQDQQQMIVEHELRHWLRRDPLWLAATQLIHRLFWFNPAMGSLALGLREAVELGCDDAVLSGRTQRERHSYAAALVAQLKVQHTGIVAAPAFGAPGVAGRVERMRKQRPARLGIAGRSVTLAAMASLVATAAMLQPAFSSTPPAGLAPTQEAWLYPIAQPRVTSLFGVVSAIVPKGHGGIDFAARTGTPVRAVASGLVIETGNNERYGNYVRIDHGAGRASQLLHLDTIAVSRGAAVRAGQLLGTSGSTGFATGPHLHLDYWQDGQRRDPALMYSDLDTHATARALARRAAPQSRLTRE